MNQFEQVVTAMIIPPQLKVTSTSATVLNTSTLIAQGGTGSAPGSAVSINCAGYNFLIVRIRLGDCAGICTAFKLQESASANMSGATDITGAVYGATGAPALPGVGSDNTTHEFYIDLANSARLQYIAPVVTVDATSTGDYVTAEYELYNHSGSLPFDNATRGVTDHVRVGA